MIDGWSDSGSRLVDYEEYLGTGGCYRLSLPLVNVRVSQILCGCEQAGSVCRVGLQGRCAGLVCSFPVFGWWQFAEVDGSLSLVNVSASQILCLFASWVGLHFSRFWLVAVCRSGA